MWVVTPSRFNRGSTPDLIHGKITIHVNRPWVCRSTDLDSFISQREQGSKDLLVRGIK
jgi:hypothetical protein